MLNQVVLMGRLTRDPELKRTPAGVAVCTVTLAVERDFADENGVREADFIDVVCWRQKAEFAARNFYKGLLVACEGRLQTRKWRDRYEQNRVSVEVAAEQLYFAERAERPVPDGSNAGANQRGIRGGRGGKIGAEQPSGEAGKDAEWGFRRQAADVTTDAPGYTGDLYRDAAGNYGTTEHDRLVRAYNDLPQSDFAGMDDEEVPF